MVIQLLYFMLAFFGTLLTGPLLLVLWILAFKTDIIRLLAEQGMLCSLVLAFYGAFASFMFFSLQDHFIVFRPAAASAALSKTELIGLIESSFTRPVEGRQLIEVARQGDKLIITWDASIDFFQITSAGSRSMKRVIILSFDEKQHKAYFVMKERDSAWRASLHGAEYSLNFSTGFSAEFRTEAYPSLSFSPAEGLRVDLKKLSYNSEELFHPIQQAVLEAGWSLHGGMVPGFGNRLLFSIPIMLLFFGIGAFLSFVAMQSGKSAAAYPSAASTSREAPMPDLATLENQLKQALPSIKTEILAVQITDIIRMPPEYVQEYAQRALPILISAYGQRKGHDEALIKEALSFAEKLKRSSKPHK